MTGLSGERELHMTENVSLPTPKINLDHPRSNVDIEKAHCAAIFPVVIPRSVRTISTILHGSCHPAFIADRSPSALSPSSSASWMVGIGKKMGDDVRFATVNPKPKDMIATAAITSPAM